MAALQIIIIIISLVLIVIAHELGHFVAAKLSGIRVDEFFVGFGPKIWSFKRGETEYGIKWLLFGGYVKIAGMNPDEEIAEEDIPRTYAGASRMKRFWVILSGSLVHIVLALIIAFMAIWLIGVPSDNATTEVAQVVLEDEAGRPTPAAQAGIQPGDVIVALDGVPFTEWLDVRDYIRGHPGESVTFTVERDASRLQLQAELGESEGQGFLGVAPTLVPERYSFIGSIGKTGQWMGEASYGVVYGVYRVFNLSTLKQLVGIDPPTVERPVSIVGISRLAGQFANEGAYRLMNFIAFLLLFLAFFNLLPLPPLDGGHLMVLGVEAVTGKPVDMRKLYPVAAVVITLLVLMFLLTLRLDILHPINLP
ncbi:MAG: M50 family metallopeptidase [Candidatus Geothermincolia bacterium]